MIPVYGFSGRLPHHQKTSFCFAINGNETSPFIHRLENVLIEYESIIQDIVLEGPSYFFPLILQAIEIAEKDDDNGTYQILLLFTDGICNDMSDTIDAIVEASFLPLSIVIIGLGDSDFSLMDALDSDENLLTDSYSRSALRDIVQFVPYNQFEGDIRLSDKILRELPDQVEEYYRYKGIQPGVPIEGLLKTKYKI